MTDFLLPLHFLKVPLPYFLFLPFYLVYLLNLILPHPHFLTNNHRHSLLDVCGLTGLTCGHAILLCHFRPRFFFFYKNSFRERNERGGKENQTTISHHYHIHTGPLPLLFFFFFTKLSPFHFLPYPDRPNRLLPYKGTSNPITHLSMLTGA